MRQGCTCRQAAADRQQCVVRERDPFLLDGETTTGQPAFVGNNVRRLAGPYAWSNALSAGYTAEELAGFADQAKNRTLPPMSAPPSRSEHSRSMVTSASIHK